MKKTKRYLGASFILAFLFCIISIPAFAATNHFSFTMNRRYISGDDTNTYHILRNGDVFITGSITSVKQNNNYGGSSPNPIIMNLYRSQTGPDKLCGKVELGKKTKITFKDKKIGVADQTSSKYYLVIYKVEQDYWTSTGEGTLFNK